MMIAGIGTKVDDKAKDYLRAINDSSLKLKDLIDNIIDVSSFDAGYVILSTKKTDIFDLVNPIVKELKAEAAKKKISLVAEISKDVGTVSVDKDRIQQALRAIINCSVAMSKEGQEVDVAVSKDDKYVIFEVSDSGTGIGEGDLKLIFDQFYKMQSDNTHGTGLGLYLAKKIIEIHLGSIDVQSKLGKGTKFTFKLPV
jgi:two-component system sensor histidine kinase ResE